MGSIATSARISLANFLESGQFADFQIVCASFTFKTHKIILCAESEYFRKLCLGPFREATEDVVRLEDQDPFLIARMLQYLYYGHYDVVNCAASLRRVLEQASSDAIPNDCLLNQDFDFEIHAQIYALAARFDIPKLQAISAANFVIELRFKDFSISDLISAIEIVYSTTIKDDIGLRKWVVYRAQSFANELSRHTDFRSILAATPQFAVDFATRFARGNYLWCSVCENTVDLVECRCGFHAMCGDPNCATEMVTELRCTNCQAMGTLQRDIPGLDENVTLGSLGRTDEPNGLIKNARKKRKMST